MAVTVYNGDRFYFVWKTEEPYNIPVTNHESPYISVCGMEFCFHLTLDFRSCNGTSMQCWVISVNRKENPVVKGKMFQVSTYVEDRQGRLQTLDQRPVTLHSDIKSQEIWQIEEVKILGRRRDFMMKGVFKFVFLFDVIPQSSSDLSKEAERDRRAVDLLSLEKLSEDMRNMREGSEYSNVILNCGDDSFLAHRNVLSARSEVLAGMFRTQIPQSQQGVVNIVDMDPPILDLFLLYVYSGRVDELTTVNAIVLYRSAHKYAVHTLVRKCASFIAENLSEDTVCDVLLLAETFEDAELMDNATSFLVGRHEVLDSAGFTKFLEQHQTIAFKVYFRIYSHV